MIIRTYRCFWFELILLLIMALLIGCGGDSKSNIVDKVDTTEIVKASLLSKYNGIDSDQMGQLYYTKQLVDSLVIPQRVIVVDAYFGVDDFFQNDSISVISIVTYDPDIQFTVNCTEQDFTTLYDKFVREPYRRGLFAIQCLELSKSTLLVPVLGDDYGVALIDERRAYVATTKLMEYYIPK